MSSVELTVRQVMQPDPVTVAPDRPIADVMLMMNRLRIGAVLVTEGDRLVGIFSERDLLRRVAVAVPGWRELPVSHWMTADPYYIGPDLGWDGAAGMMHRLRVRHLPVVEAGLVIGIISTRSLMARRTEYLDQKIDERTLELKRANDQLLARDAESVANLRVAGRLQTKLLLPQAPPEWPELDWAIHFAPLAHLGGDYYDFARPDDDSLGILIADAAGHSLPAAMVAMMARIAFGEVAGRTRSPGEVLTEMNGRLTGLTDERFVTAFYAVLDRRSRVLRYASAGHPSPLLIRPAAESVRPLGAQGFLLGIMPDERYVEREIVLEPGDRVCFYTDGLVEARNEIGELYGTDRLKDCLLRNARESAATLLTRVRECRRAFCGTQPAEDDLTIVVMALGAG
jgi:serine phosphatase RsbU (regulator of sigma subunit)/CBS domain-containing protein